MTRMIACAALASVALSAQTFERRNGFAIEVSLENTHLPRLPMHRNAITSLEVVGDYIVGGTSAGSGLSPYLFAASLTRRQVETVFQVDEAAPGQRSIPGGFGRASDGSLYCGTMPQSDGAGGHLLRVALSNGRLQVRDIGVPVPGEGIFSVTADRKTDTVYGIASPSGRFFSFRIADGKIAVYDQTVPSLSVLKALSSYLLTPEDYLSRRLVIDAAGRVYGSCPPGRLFRFDPQSRKFEFLDNLPSVSGRLFLSRADSWATGPNGLLYGGNAGDGQLFTVDPRTAQLANLGKPALMPRMRGLAFGRDGVLYGVNGGAPGYAHVFSYESARGFTDLGNPVFVMSAPGIEKGIPWRGFQLEAVTASEDGRYIVMGEAEALSQLMVFEVDDKRLVSTR